MSRWSESYLIKMISTQVLMIHLTFSRAWSHQKEEADLELARGLTNHLIQLPGS